MKTIWKYPCPMQDNFTLIIPVGARFLSLHTQYGNPCLWFLVDDWAPTQPRHFLVRETGQQLPPQKLTFLGTCLIHGDSLVLHVFEEAPCA